MLLTSVLSAQNVFYYYKGEKVYLKEKNDRVLLKFNSVADKIESLRTIQNESLFEVISKVNDVSPFVIIQSNDKNPISSSTLNKFQNSINVSSALPMLEYKDQSLQGLTDQFVVKLKKGVQFEKFQELLKINSCLILNKNKFVEDQYLISISRKSNLNSLQLANLFYETGFFEFAEPNFFRTSISQSNDPLFGNQWTLKNTGQGGGIIGADIKIEEAWTITEGRPEIRVAVVDDGVDLTHSDLSSNLLPGFDATGNGTAGAPLPGEFHGTACAGIIAAVKDNGIGISGVAPKCKILPVHASYNNSATNIWLSDGIMWAAHSNYGNADVISNSWGGGAPSSVITNAIDYATSQGRDGLGCVLLFASGNDASQTVSYPAYLPNVIAVGATSKSDNRTTYSNYGNAIDVVAPGGYDDIYTTDITGYLGYSTSDYTNSFDGTSAACPHAAGVAALILSVNRCLTASQVQQILELSCDKTSGVCYSPGKPNGTWNIEMGYGRINAYKAVQYAYSLQTNTFINTNGTDQGSTGNFQWYLTSGGCTGLSAATYIVKRHEVQATVTYPYTQAPILVGSANGLSAANPNDGNYYMEVISVTPTTATVRTWVYEVVSTILGQPLSWVPTSPSNVRFNFGVLSSLNADLYFQNTTVTGTEIHNVMNEIKAGKNVMPSNPVGDYIIQSGANVTFHAGNEIILSDGFTANIGSSFYAIVEPFFTCTQYPLGIINTPLPVIDYEVEYLEEIKPPLYYTSSNTNLSIYPNPSHGDVSIKYNIDKVDLVEIILYDSFGKPVFKLKNRSSHEAGTYTISINNIDLPSGIYHCVLQTSNIFISKELILIK